VSVFNRPSSKKYLHRQMKFDAIIFDCDGTLADTMPCHYEAWQVVAARHSLELSEDRFYALGGWPTKKILYLLKEETGLAFDPAAVAHEKELEFERRLHRVEPIAPVVAAVHQHRGQRPIAVATGAVRRICEKILGHISLAEAFDAMVTADDVHVHKPEPEIFLEAARRLGVAPDKCQVWEDTDPGIEAARRAGMAWVDVRTLHTPRRVTGESEKGK